MRAPPTVEPPLHWMDRSNGSLSGEQVAESRTTIGGLAGVFADEQARAKMAQDTVVYRVQICRPVAEDTAGGLLFGISCLQPGTVGDEHFMTRGHFHRRRESGEFYWGIAGEGLLLLMDEQRHTRVVRICPGSLSYVPGRVAHRLVNTGGSALRVGACWPADAGHDYGALASEGFSVRVRRGRCVAVEG